MSRGLVQPLFPNAPRDYNAEYMAEVTRAFSVFLQQVNNPGPWQASALTLPNYRLTIITFLLVAFFSTAMSCVLL